MRDNGYGEPVTVVSDEKRLPYQRPPLSKNFLQGKLESERLCLTTAEALASARIELIQGTRAVDIDRQSRRIGLTGGQTLPYAHLTLATGSRNRRLRGGPVDGFCSLRDVEDAIDLRDRLPSATNLIVIGAGFLGLEIASVATELGLPVDVVEMAPTPMTRGLTQPVAHALTARHRSRGVRFHFGRSVTKVEASAGKLSGVVLDDGTKLAGNLVVVSIGVVPNSDLAVGAGLEVADGIIVNGSLRTSDPAISAIGDCCAFHTRFADSLVRLESVQNAVDQGRFVAASIVQRAQNYDALPWFWTTQAGVRVQMAGLATAQDEVLINGDPGTMAFSVFALRGDSLVAVHSMNRPADHLAARRILSRGRLPSRKLLGDPGFSLKTWAAEVAEDRSSADDNAAPRIHFDE